MIAQHYVNSPADEGRKRRENSGQSNVIRVIGVTFGLLCITQAALNVYLRLRRDPIVKSDLIFANMTLSADISALQEESGRLATENRELQAVIDRLSREKKELSDQNSRQQLRIAELQQQLSATETNLQSCDSGWILHKSSCYQMSTGRAGRRHATSDCEAKGAHLVIVNNGDAKDVLIFLKRRDVWIGLKAVHQNQKTTWMWDNGYQLTADCTPVFLSMNHQDSDCVYAEVQLDGSMVWFQVPCEDHHYWVCEKDLK